MTSYNKKLIGWTSTYFPHVIHDNLEGFGLTQCWKINLKKDLGEMTITSDDDVICLLHLSSKCDFYNHPTCINEEWVLAFVEELFVWFIW